MKTLILGLMLALVSAPAAFAADAAAGKAVFTQWCTGCHAPLENKLGGLSPPAGTYTLEQRYKGSKPAALEQRTDLTAAYVKSMVRNGQGMMPQTRKTEITDQQLDDLAAYLAKGRQGVVGK